LRELTRIRKEPGSNECSNSNLDFWEHEGDRYCNFSQLRLGDPKGLPSFFCRGVSALDGEGDVEGLVWLDAFGGVGALILFSAVVMSAGAGAADDVADGKPIALA
jgi:hypothetical protein